jgi:integrase
LTEPLRRTLFKRTCPRQAERQKGSDKAVHVLFWRTLESQHASHEPPPPAYRRHKARNLAVVTIAGKDRYLGPYGSPESHEMYAQLIAQWHACGRRPAALEAATPQGDAHLTVNELILRYWDFAQGYYVKNGRPTGESDNIRHALRPLRKLFGHSAAAAFGPKSLLLVRQAMIDAGLTRKVINARVGRVKRLFRWAARQELIPPGVYHGLLAVEGLQRGRSAAREAGPVTTVPEAQVRATLPFLPQPVRAMVQVQELAGMRPQDIRNIRTCDLDRTRDVWVYTPWTHKTEHHGHVRQVAIGPHAQEILRPFLRPDAAAAFVFSPREAVAQIRAERATRRKTRRTPSEQQRARKVNPKRRPSEHYTKTAYETAVARACRRAGVPRWCPNQLRHNCATRVRRLYGLDAAAAVLGHRLGSVTEIYAEADLQKAIRVMREIG